MRIAIIIPTYKRERELLRCVNALGHGMLMNAEIEVIISDDSGGSKTLPGVEFPFTVRRVRGPGKGPAANRNFGASQTTADWLVFLDDDCIPSPQFLGAYKQAFESFDPKCCCALFVGKTIRNSEPPSLLWEAPHNPDCLAAITCNLGVSRAFFEQSGRFDARYPFAFEDMEYQARCTVLGAQLIPVWLASVEHPLRQCPSALKMAKRWEGQFVYAIDQGAGISGASWRVPWHVFRVIPTRFRNSRMRWSTVKAAFFFSCEMFAVLLFTPYWAVKWSTKVRSVFWREHVKKVGPQPKYGL